MQTRRQIEEEILRKKNELETAQRLLAEADRACGHIWNDPILMQEYKPAYYVNGDPPNFGGVDRQFGYWVESKTINRWKRKCKKCGKEEVTDRFKPIVTTTNVPIF